MLQASSEGERRAIAASWRADLLRRFAWLLFLSGIPLAAYVLVVVPLPAKRTPLQIVAVSLVPLTAALAALAPFRATLRGAALVASLLFLAGVGAKDWGPTPVVLFCSSLGALLTTLLFGLRAGALVLVASSVNLLACGAGGRFETSAAWAGSLLLLQTWVRFTVVYALLTAALQLLVSGAVRRVETSLRETQSALAAAVREHAARVETERALDENEEHLRLALAAARMGTWEWDVASGKVIWTGHAEALLGVPAGAPATIETFRATIHAEDRAGVERAIEAALAGPGDDFQEQHRDHGDPPRWLRGRGRVYRDAAGRALRLRGTVEDVTDQKQVEEQLRASEDRWRRISESTFEGIGFSENGVIVDTNAQLAEMLGYTPQELVGRPVLDVVAPEDRERVQAALRGGQRGAYEHHALCKDGSTVLVETRAHPLTEGSRVRVTAVRDVSERSRLEAELRRREQLAAIGALVGGVAHEVRNPLFVISATLDALEARARGRPHGREEDGELKERLRAQVHRLANLMQDLLDYSRPPRLRLARVSVAQAVRLATQHCRTLADEGGVRISDELPTGLPELTLDVDRIEQVFGNLIANAVQHSPRGATVTLSGTACELPWPGLAVVVEDEGPGLRPGDSEQVFKPFFSRRKGGTGLGLAVAQRFVEAHGGRLVAGNRPGGGAVFTVFLPHAVPDGAAQAV